MSSELISSIIEEGNQWKKVIDKKVEDLIRSVNAKEADDLFNAKVYVEMLKTALEKEKKILRDGGQLEEEMIKPARIPFAQYNSKEAIKTETDKLIGALMTKDNMEPTTKQYKYGCLRCWYIRKSKRHPGEMKKEYTYRCSKCGEDTSSDARPLEIKIPKYRFECELCGRCTTFRYANLREHKYTCECGKRNVCCGTVILGTAYRFRCTTCNEGYDADYAEDIIGENLDIKEKWRFFKSESFESDDDSSCNTCRDRSDFDFKIGNRSFFDDIFEDLLTYAGDLQ